MSTGLTKAVEKKSSNNDLYFRTQRRPGHVPPIPTLEEKKRFGTRHRRLPSSKNAKAV